MEKISLKKILERHELAASTRPEILLRELVLEVENKINEVVEKVNIFEQWKQ